MHLMKRLFYPFEVILIALTLHACRGPHDSAEAVLRAWVGRELRLPDDAVLRNAEGDIFLASMVDTARWKVVSYVDSTGCTGCRLGAAQWKGWIDLVRREGLDVTVWLFLSPKDEDATWELLRNYDFHYPVCMSSMDRVGLTATDWPEEEAYRTFLLDETDKVVAIGNPAHNGRISQLYRRIIAEGEDTPADHRQSMATTEVEVTPTAVDLGQFPKDMPQEVAFVLRNVGRTPLFILEAKASCDCVEVVCPTEPIAPEATGIVALTFKARSPGRLRRSVWLRCNVDNVFVKLTLTGEAV